MAFLASAKLVMDYNVTCPDYRYCTVRHRFSSPCELWDCNACWWHYKNCSKTEEPATDNCPYVTCYDVPRPSHNHTVATVSGVSIAVFAALFFFFLRRRFRARSTRDADAEGESDREDEHLPLLQRCRVFFQQHTTPPSQVAERFRRLVWGGERANVAPPESLDAELGNQAPRGQEEHRPSAPPPPYEEIQNAPIVRHLSSSRSLENQNYGSMDERRVCGSPRTREAPRLQEIPLTHRAAHGGHGGLSSRHDDDDASEARRVPRARGASGKVSLTVSQSLR